MNATSLFLRLLFFAYLRTLIPSPAPSPKALSALTLLCDMEAVMLNFLQPGFETTLTSHGMRPLPPHAAVTSTSLFIRMPRLKEEFVPQLRAESTAFKNSPILHTTSALSAKVAALALASELLSCSIADTFCLFVSSLAELE